MQHKENVVTLETVEREREREREPFFTKCGKILLTNYALQQKYKKSVPMWN